MQSGPMLFFVWISGSVAFIALTAATVLIILDVVSSAILYPALTLAAGSLDAIALLLLVFAFILHLSNRKHHSHSRWRSLILPLVAAVIGIGAAATTLVAFILKNVDRGVGSDSQENGVLVLAGISVAAVSAAAQFAFYSSVLFRFAIIGNSYTRSPEILEVAEPSSPITPSRPSTTLKKFSPQKQFSRNHPPCSPAFTANSESSLPSSVQNIATPTASKTRLLRSRGASSKDSTFSRSLRNSMESISQSDAFDNWDTSGVDPQTRDAVFHSTHPTTSFRGLPLETIPGSRPASPGRPLEGPFPESSSPVSPAGYDGSSSPLRPGTAERSGSPSFERPETARTNCTNRSFPSRSRTIDSRAGSTLSLSSASRPTSPSIHEAHIHPLFRSDSPTPPPAATPGTIIHASPIGGRYMPGPPRPFVRSRTASAETLRARSSSFGTPITRAASESVRAASPSPLHKQRSFDDDHSSSMHDSCTGHMTPPIREMTPPIPDFVLSGVS